jgi:hypothetical protein
MKKLFIPNGRVASPGGLAGQRRGELLQLVDGQPDHQQLARAEELPGL